MMRIVLAGKLPPLVAAVRWSARPGREDSRTGTPCYTPARSFPFRAGLAVSGAHPIGRRVLAHAPIRTHARPATRRRRRPRPGGHRSDDPADHHGWRPD